GRRWRLGSCARPGGICPSARPGGGGHARGGSRGGPGRCPVLRPDRRHPEAAPGPDFHRLHTLDLTKRTTMATNAVISPAGSMIGATGLRARIPAVTSFPWRFPLIVHQVLLRLAIGRVFVWTGPQKGR